jgi:ribosomal RNA assembly protein
MAEQEIKVTQNRIAVIIGKNGKTKRTIEKSTETSLKIDSEEGLVTVSGEDPVNVLNTSQIIRAINRGFSPKRALTLLDDEDMMLDIIDLTAYCNTTKQMERIRGRIIGREGKSREQIEDMTGAIMSVLGKTVAIIGEVEQVRNTRTAVEMLIEGLPHESVFSFLDKKNKEAKQNMLEYYY